ncbi:MAG: hypothetical protein FJZ87_14780 [Chloroflexi bacterium]|nr:hypothetical protein [Chloroflexota bacterium]
MNFTGIISDRRFQFLLVVLIGAAVTWISGVYSGFFVSLNDFWTVLYYGRHMTWAHKESLYNSFYPFGYAFIIGQLPYTYAIQLSYMVNALLTGLLLASVAMLVREGGFPSATVLAAGISIFQPLAFHYANTPGPDIGAAAFPAFAAYLLWRDGLVRPGKVETVQTSILIGASLGLGCLWRSHVIVLAAALLVFALLFRRHANTRVYVWMLVSFAFVLSIQVAVDLLSGHKPLETAQIFNVYKLFYGLDWANPPSREQLSRLSILNLLITDPGSVIRTIWPYFKYLAAFSLSGIVLWIVAIDSPLKQFASFSTWTILLYSVPLSFSDSPRAPLAVIGLTLVCAGLILVALYKRICTQFRVVRRPEVWVTMLALIVCVFPVVEWIKTDWTFLEGNRMGYRIFKDMEQILLKNGATSPDQVFSNRYSYYLPTRPPYTTRHFAYTSNQWLWGFEEEYPYIPNDSWENFRETCLEQGIQFLVITPFAADQAAFFGEIYENNFDGQALGVEFIAQRTTSRIFKFQ